MSLRHKAVQFPLGGLLIILACQWCGSVIVALSGLPLPGAVLGMLIFFVYLQWQQPPPQAGSVRAADGLLAHLQLFFVPPGVGIIAHWALLRNQWLPFVGGLVGGWLVAHLMTAVTAVMLLHLLRRRSRGAEV